MKLGRFSREELCLYSWWSTLAAKIGVSVIMDLVSDMFIDVKRAVRLNTFVMPFYFLYLP